MSSQSLTHESSIISVDVNIGGRGITPFELVGRLGNLTEEQQLRMNARMANWMNSSGRRVFFVYVDHGKWVARHERLTERNLLGVDVIYYKHILGQDTLPSFAGECPIFDLTGYAYRKEARDMKEMKEMKSPLPIIKKTELSPIAESLKERLHTLMVEEDMCRNRLAHEKENLKSLQEIRANVSQALIDEIMKGHAK